jgi:hypothetical protein
VSLVAFGGLVPRSDPLTLPTGGAQKAINCRLTAGGILEAYKEPVQVFQPATVGIKSIYRFRQTLNSDTEFWFTSAERVSYVKGAIAGDTEERTYYTGDGFPKVTKMDMATLSQPYPSNYYRLGLPAIPDIPTATIAASGHDDVALVETRFYVYTFVTSLGEESPPSQVSAALECYPGDTITVLMGSTPSGAYDVINRRIYRTSSGSTSTEYLFVAEIAASASSCDDAVLAENLGEPCPTVTYSQLPDLAQWLTGMANGMMAACTLYDVYFCEAWKPYAWPEGYIQTVAFPIVGMGAFNQSLVVLTNGTPYVMTGMDPSSVSVEQLSVNYPCVSAPSIVSAMNSVIYAAPDGLVSISASGPVVLTESLFTRREWSALNPASMICEVWDEKIFIFFDNGVKAGLILDTQTGLTSTTVHATATFVDPVTNSMFLAINDKIVKWDGGAAGTYTWKSRKLNMPVPRNFAYGQVLADTYPLVMNVYADDVLVHTESVTSSLPFRLPSGFRARYWEMELVGQGRTFLAYFADSTAELQSV